MKRNISTATKNGCVIPPFAIRDSSSAPVSLRLHAKPLSPCVSNVPACSGPSAEPTPSSLFAAHFSATASKTTGNPVAPPPDLPFLCPAPLRDHYSHDPHLGGGVQAVPH